MFKFENYDFNLLLWSFDRVIIVVGVIMTSSSWMISNPVSEKLNNQFKKKKKKKDCPSHALKLQVSL